jgi:hypothetical protein
MSARLPALVFIQVSLSYYVFLAINDIEIARGLSPFNPERNYLIRTICGRKEFEKHE